MFCSQVVSAVLKGAVGGGGADKEKGWPSSKQRDLLRWVPCVMNEGAGFTFAIPK